METLILTAAFEPVQRIPWQRAMTLWMGGRVEVVEAYDNQPVRTVHDQYAMPAVVRFLRGVRRRGRGRVKFSRKNVYLRDAGQCQYCLRSIERREATFDHVLPRSRGGRTTWDNVVVACFACNQKKGSRMPAEAGMKLRMHPIQPKTLPSRWGLGVAWETGMPAAWRTYLPG